MSTQTHIQSLLQSLFIFSAKEKADILGEYANATDSSTEKLVTFLQDAQEKQQLYLERMISVDPQFVHKTKKFMQETVGAMQPGQQQSETDRIRDIEAEFDS